MSVDISMLWVDKSDKTKAILTKSNGETVILSVGDFIIYAGRPDGVRIDRFSYKNEEDDGPIGIEYVPWRKETKKWGSILWSLRGNLRHLIASPYGRNHYGEHPDWDSVVKAEYPEESKLNLE